MGNVTPSGFGNHTHHYREIDYLQKSLKMSFQAKFRCWNSMFWVSSESVILFHSLSGTPWGDSEGQLGPPFPMGSLGGSQKYPEEQQNCAKLSFFCQIQVLNKQVLEIFSVCFFLQALRHALKGFRRTTKCTIPHGTPGGIPKVPRRAAKLPVNELFSQIQALTEQVL